MEINQPALTPQQTELIPAHIRARLSLPWHIDRAWGIAALGKYLGNLEAMNSGARSEEVFERMRSLMAPAITDLQGQVIQTGAATVLSGRPVPPGSVLRLNLIGPMIANGDLCAWGMDEYEEAIMMANANPNIEGIFIRANTGGGEAMAGQILHNAVKSSQKAVVVYADFLASAGVHGTLAADEIIAGGPQSRIGSIGTYVSIDKELVQWYQDNVDDIYADVSPEKNADWRAYLAGDPEPLKKSVNQNAKLFQNDVKAYRNLGAHAEETLRGDVFFAQDAKRRGLIDGIGTMDYALSRMQANIKRRKQRG